MSEESFESYIRYVEDILQRKLTPEERARLDEACIDVERELAAMRKGDFA
jgi:hypothetical protein